MTNRAVCTSTGAPQGSRHAGRWHQAALSETVNNHGFDLQRVQAIGQQAHRAPDGAPVHHERHRPEQTTLYRLVKQHFACFFGQVVCRQVVLYAPEDAESGRSLRQSKRTERLKTRSIRRSYAAAPCA